MDTYGLQSTSAHANHADGSDLSWPSPKENSRYSLRSGSEPPLSTDPSPHSYYTANTLPLSHLTTNATSKQPSNMSFPYSVTSISSRKSRKNGLHPRRVHPLPVPLASGHPVSSDVRVLSSFLLLLLLNLYAPALHIAPNLASSVPLYNLIAVLGDPSCACGKSVPPVFGAPRGLFATYACSD